MPSEATQTVVTGNDPPLFSEGNTYDRVPYPSYAFAHSHPDRLAIIASMFGANSAPVTRCRILELGCASGGNLIPMAAALPDSTFVGLDSSRQQVAQGQQAIVASGQQNVALRHADILEVGPEYGEFDYIICHGVFSWVPDEVRLKIAQICKQNLAPHGVAYVSYNCYPGWNMRGTIRDMMCYHASKFDDPSQQVREARAVLDFMADAVVASGKDDSYGKMLKRELEVLRNKSDSYLLHEHLEEFNDPLYFFEFIEIVRDAGLQYLAEAAISSMWVGNLQANIAQTLDKITTDIIQMEQYLDFLRNRMFRQTLLCHAEVKLERRMRPEQLAGRYLSAAVRPADPKQDPCAKGSMEFHNRAGTKISTNDLRLKTALACLSDIWPASIQFESLLSMVGSRLEAYGVQAIDEEFMINLKNDLLRSYASDLVEVATRSVPIANKLPARPRVTPYARYQAEQGSIVTNLRHETVQLNDIERALVQRLDGTRDVESLSQWLHKLVEDGTLSVNQSGVPVESAADIDRALDHVLRDALPGLLNKAMLLP